MIGLSLSFCVADIISGEVPLKNVDLIIAGTAFRTPEQLDGLIKQYKQSHWLPDKNHVADAKQIIDHLLMYGKIYQPRIYGEKAPNISGGVWVNDVKSLAKNRKCTECAHLTQRDMTCRLKREETIYPEDYRQPLISTIDPGSSPYQLGCFHYFKRWEGKICTTNGFVFIIH